MGGTGIAYGKHGIVSTNRFIIRHFHISGDHKVSFLAAKLNFDMYIHKAIEITNWNKWRKFSERVSIVHGRVSVDSRIGKGVELDWLEVMELCFGFQ